MSDFVNQNIASYTEIETFMKASSMDIYDTEYTFKNGEIILKEATESKIVIQFKNAVWDTVRRLPSENENLKARLLFSSKMPYGILLGVCRQKMKTVHCL